MCTYPMGNVVEHLNTLTSPRIEEFARPMSRVTRILPALALLAALVAAGCGGQSGSGGDGSKGKLSLVAYSTPQEAYQKIIPAFQKTSAGKGEQYAVDARHGPANSYIRGDVKGLGL